MRARRLLLMVAGLGLLGGCGNLVHSEQPLFSAADEAGAPTLRPGVWIGEDPDCRFDEAQPVEAWPKCADPVTLGRLGLKDPKLDMAVDRVAAGDPAVVQLGDTSGYSYLAMLVTKTDRRGRVTAAQLWPALCGPPPPKSASGEPAPSKVTRDPLPGLEIRGDDCLAADQAAVRASVRASKAWVEAPMGFHWVRDAKP